MNPTVVWHRESLNIAMLAFPAMMICSAATAADEKPSRIEMRRNDAQGQLSIRIDGKEAIVYQYGKDWDLAHYYPVRSPSGRLLTVQKADSYPHMRSFWIADKVQLEDHKPVSFYDAYFSKVDPKHPDSPYRDHIRHVDFLPGQSEGNQAQFGMKLVWEMDFNVPVLDEERRMRIVGLEQGEYFLDLAFTVTASYGDVMFLSDWSHYAWPYVRMDPEFSEEKGGTITNSEGGTQQQGTRGKRAHWVDYANAVDGVMEGLAIFSHVDNPYPHQWFTRVYGCFGPRRADDRSGKPFMLHRGETLRQRVGIFVHRGNVHEGRVAERYQQYTSGKL